VVIEDDRTLQGRRARDPNLCFPPQQPAYGGGRGRLFQKAARSRGGVVATQSPQAARAAIKVLKGGGNAIDAAVTAAFVVGVARPELSGIGGGGWLLYRGSGGKTAALDFKEVAPAAVGPTTFEGTGAYDFGTGHMKVGVPGLVAGATKALRRFGTISLARAIAPAERLARRGIVISPELSDSYTAQQVAAPYEITARLRLFPESARIYLDETGLPPKPGSRLVLSDYADSLRLIAEQGSDAFYRGPIARQIVEEMERSQSSPYPGDQGLMTLEDLASYKAKWRRPLEGTYRGHTVIGAPPPSAGGIFTLEWLNILRGFDLRSAGHSSADHLHLAAEAQKIAFADRTAYVADPAFVDVPTKKLISKRYAAKRRREIKMDRAGDYEPGRFQGFGAPSVTSDSSSRGHHTTHISVIDRRGNAVALTSSIGSSFGSAVVARGTGFPLNDELNTSQTGIDRPQGGKRQRTSNSPTIVVRRGKPILVTGGAVFTHILMGTALSVSNVIDFDMNVAEAIDAARINEFSCCSLEIEETRVEPSVLEELAGRGHELSPLGEYGFAPIMQLAGSSGRHHMAASDPRDEWGAAAQRSP
jgi:gamma-glutamyltranspeptidase/glutathione hydrolase